MAGYVTVQNASPVVRNDEETVEYLEHERWYSEEAIVAIASRWLRRNVIQRAYSVVDDPVNACTTLRDSTRQREECKS